MQLDLYKALIGIKINEDQATSVVEAMNTHIDQRISAATSPLLSRLDSMQTALSAKIDAVGQVNKDREASKERTSILVRWVITSVVAAVGVTLGALKALGYI